MPKCSPHISRLPLYLLLVIATTPCLAQTDIAAPVPHPILHNDAPSLKAIAAATSFMDSLIGNAPVETLSNLCSLPFCHDDSVIVLTRSELNIALKQLLSASAAISKNNHPHVDSAYVLDMRKEVLFGMVPINIYFTVIRIKFSAPGRAQDREAAKLLILAIQITDDARIVGIQD